ncbi:MAG TPA: hypothetical protein VK659_24895, partial [Asanoa sp.]|nr:hypothetical protein [Asanoa sp.]
MTHTNSAKATLRRLDALIGEWTMHASIGGTPTGLARTTFRWSTEGAFVVQHADSETSDIDIPAGWLANSPFPTTTIIGLDDDSG